MKKTTVEWLMELPKEIREKAFKNQINKGNTESLKDALIRGFLWADSPEGHQYWSRVYDMVSIDTLPPDPKFLSPVHEAFSLWPKNEKFPAFKFDGVEYYTEYAQGTSVEELLYNEARASQEAAIETYGEGEQWQLVIDFLKSEI